MQSLWPAEAAAARPQTPCVHGKKTRGDKALIHIASPAGGLYQVGEMSLPGAQESGNGGEKRGDQTPPRQFQSPACPSPPRGAPGPAAQRAAAPPPPRPQAPAKTTKNTSGAP